MGSIEERTRLSQALNDIDLRIHSKLGTEQIMQLALDGFVEALHAEAGDIKIREGDQWVVQYEHGFGPDEVGRRLESADAPIASRVAELRAPVAIIDFRTEPEACYVGFPRIHGLRATMAIPLIVREEVVGSLFAWMKHEPRDFTDAEVDFGRRMAASVALALENSRLYTAEQEARQRAESAERRLGQEVERIEVLLRASDELTSTTNSNELLLRVADIVRDATGISRALINLVDINRQILTPMVSTAAPVAPQGRHIPFGALSETARRTITNGRTTLLDYEREDTPEEDRAIAQTYSCRLALFVPLAVHGVLIGHITLDDPGDRHEFSTAQIRLVESIAAQAAVALQNARVFEREHRIAEALQQAILSPPEDLKAVEVAHLYQPASAAADVGGDFYDVFDLGAGRVAFVIGDIAGKGIDAARLTTLVRDGARAYLIEDGDPCSVLSRLNALTYRFTPVDKFATVFVGIWDSASGVLDYCSVGHPAPLVAGNGSPRTLESEPGLLGAFPEARFASLATRLEPDDVLVLVTDGVTEARRGSEMFGETGTLGALERLRGTPVCRLPEALLAEVVAFAGGALRDDVVILCASLKP